MRPSLRLRLRLALLTVALAAGLMTPGCVFCSFLEYGEQCCGACGTLCGQTCLPLCIDTALGRGPFNKAGATPMSSESDPALPALKAQPTAVAY
jgi:hypothetical protein